MSKRKYILRLRHGLSFPDNEQGDRDALAAIKASTFGATWNNVWDDGVIASGDLNALYGVSAETIGAEQRVVGIKLNGNENYEVYLVRGSADPNAAPLGGNNLGRLNEGVAEFTNVTSVNGNIVTDNGYPYSFHRCRVELRDSQNNAVANVMTPENGSGDYSFTDLTQGNYTAVVEWCEGSIPNAIGNLKKCKYFNVKQNYLRSEIPDGFYYMESLENAYLNGSTADINGDDRINTPKTDGMLYTMPTSNQIIGTIKPLIGQLTNLKRFSCYGQGIYTPRYTPYKDGLTGQIPTEVSQTSLIAFAVGGNELSNFQALDGCAGIKSVEMKQNDTIGENVDWIVNKTSLFQFSFGTNFGGGEWPNPNVVRELPDVSQLTNLVTFGSMRGMWSGSIPPELCDGTIPGLNTANLAWNRWNGSMPEFGMIESHLPGGNVLRVFNVAGADFSLPVGEGGGLPNSWTNAYQLIQISMDNCGFKGPLPDFNRFIFPRYIDVSFNDFEGGIPDHFGLPKYIQDSFPPNPIQWELCWRTDLEELWRWADGAWEKYQSPIQWINLAGNNLSGPISANFEILANTDWFIGTGTGPNGGFKYLNISGNNFQPSDYEHLVTAFAGSSADLIV